MSVEPTGATAAGALRAATTLALWAAAWQGGASSDDVLTAIDDPDHRAGARAATAEIAERTGLPGPGSASAGTAALLPLLRAGGPPELLLPRPGDLRGLPPGGGAAVAGLDSGAVVRLPESGLLFIPGAGQWRIFAGPVGPGCGGSVPPDIPVAHDVVDEEMTRATRLLTALDVARGSDQAREQVRLIMLQEAVTTPPGTPSAAGNLLATAISLQALLTVASRQETAAVTSGQIARVDDALRPLADAVAQARRAAVATAVRSLARADGRVPGRRWVRGR